MSKHPQAHFLEIQTEIVRKVVHNRGLTCGAATLPETSLKTFFFLMGRRRNITGPNFEVLENRHTGRGRLKLWLKERSHFHLLRFPQKVLQNSQITLKTIQRTITGVILKFKMLQTFAPNLSFFLLEKIETTVIELK